MSPAAAVPIQGPIVAPATAAYRGGRDGEAGRHRPGTGRCPPWRMGIGDAFDHTDEIVLDRCQRRRFRVYQHQRVALIHTVVHRCALKIEQSTETSRQRPRPRHGRRIAGDESNQLGQYERERNAARQSQIQRPTRSSPP